MNIRILMLCVLLISARAHAAASCSSIFNGTADIERQSDKYSWLESETPETIKRIRDENALVNASLDRSANAPILESLIRDQFVQEKTAASSLLADGSVLRLVNLGIGKGEFLKLGDQTLFTNLEIDRDGGAHIDSIRLSPNEHKVLLNYVTGGSTDDYRSIVYDLKLKCLTGPAVENAESQPVWHSDDTYLSSRYANGTKIRTLVEFDLKGQAIEHSQGYINSRSRDGATLWSRENGLEIILRDGSHFAAPGAEKVIGVLDQSVVYLLKGSAGRAISTGRIEKGKLVDVKTIVPETDWAINEEKVIGNQVVYRRSRGDERILVVRDLDGTLVKEIKLPNGLQGFIFSWVKPGEVLRIGLTSAVNDTKYFDYDLKTGFKVDVEKRMFTKDGIEYRSEVREVTSADGTKIPVRLTSRKDAPRNGSAPGYLEVYGGFNKPSSFDPRYNVMTAFFMENGGVLVHPAVRGGDEFGKAWHEAAMKGKKAKTFEDVIATSKQLSRSGFFSKKKLVLTGASNGGMVTAATALKSPSSFGLVIPINGVQDSYGKESLDPRHGNGWTTEYGDSRTEPEIFEDYAPVEIAARPGKLPKFLILVGRNDSRVNPAHSRKLLEALRSQPGRDVNIYSLKKAGHWMNSLPYQDWIAWRTQVVMWTTIYDFVGIKLKPLEPKSESIKAAP